MRLTECSALSDSTFLTQHQLEKLHFDVAQPNESSQTCTTMLDDDGVNATGTASLGLFTPRNRLQ